MPLIRVSQQVQIQAPVEKVFALITQLERCLQLAPDWGEYLIGGVEPAYPQAGSRYFLSSHRQETVSQAAQELDTASRQEFPVTVIDYMVDQLFATRAGDPAGTLTTWSLHADQQTGPTWLELSREQHLPEPEPEAAEEAGEDSTPPASPEALAEGQIKEWLNNIKQYAELGDSRSHRLFKWVMDHYLLKLRAQQRRIILALLALQVVTCLTFLAAVFGLGLISLLLRR